MSQKLEARSLNLQLDFGADESARSAYPSASMLGTSPQMRELTLETPGQLAQITAYYSKANQAPARLPPPP